MSQFPPPEIAADVVEAEGFILQPEDPPTSHVHELAEDNQIMKSIHTSSCIPTSTAYMHDIQGKTPIADGKNDPELLTSDDQSMHTASCATTTERTNLLPDSGYPVHTTSIVDTVPQLLDPHQPVTSSGNESPSNLSPRDSGVLHLSAFPHTKDAASLCSNSVESVPDAAEHLLGPTLTAYTQSSAPPTSSELGKSVPTEEYSLLSTSIASSDDPQGSLEPSSGPDPSYASVTISVTNPDGIVIQEDGLVSSVHSPIGLSPSPVEETATDQQHTPQQEAVPDAYMQVIDKYSCAGGAGCNPALSTVLASDSQHIPQSGAIQDAYTQCIDGSSGPTETGRRPALSTASVCDSSEFLTIVAPTGDSADDPSGSRNDLLQPISGDHDGSAEVVIADASSCSVPETSTKATDDFLAPSTSCATPLVDISTESDDNTGLPAESATVPIAFNDCSSASCAPAPVPGLTLDLSAGSTDPLAEQPHAGYSSADSNENTANTSSVALTGSVQASPLDVANPSTDLLSSESPASPANSGDGISSTDALPTVQCPPGSDNTAPSPTEDYLAPQPVLEDAARSASSPSYGAVPEDESPAEERANPLNDSDASDAAVSPDVLLRPEPQDNDIRDQADVEAGYMHHEDVEEPPSPCLPPSSLPSSQVSDILLPAPSAAHSEDYLAHQDIHVDETKIENAETPESLPLPSSQPRSSSPEPVFSSPPAYALSSPPTSPHLLPEDKAKGRAEDVEMEGENIEELVLDAEAKPTKRPAEDDLQDDIRDIKRMRTSASYSPPPPPNPKRPTVQGQKKLHRKLAQPFRSPIVKIEDILAGKDGVYASGRARRSETPVKAEPGEEMALEDGIAGSDSAELEVSHPPSKSLATKDRTANAGRPFKALVVQPGGAPPGTSATSAGGVKTASTIQALQARVQKLKQAIRIKSDDAADGARRLDALVTKWRTVGREVAWLVWDTVKDRDPGDSLRVLPAKGGWDEDEVPGGGKRAGGFGSGGFQAGWGYDDGKSGSGKHDGFAGSWGWDDKKEGGSGEAGEVEERMDVDEEAEGQTQNHSLGTMLRFMGVDPETLGWDEDEGDFVGEP